MWNWGWCLIYLNVNLVPVFLYHFHHVIFSNWICTRKIKFIPCFIFRWCEHKIFISSFTSLGVQGQGCYTFPLFVSFSVMRHKQTPVKVAHSQEVSTQFRPSQQDWERCRVQTESPSLWLTEMKQLSREFYQVSQKVWNSLKSFLFLFSLVKALL